MNTNESSKKTELTPEDLAHLGGGALGYIRQIEMPEAKRLLGGKTMVKPDAKLLLF